jgi:hypothetical protein
MQMNNGETIRLTGRCLCGAVRYECNSTILFASICYCEDCRRWSGSGHMAVVGVPRVNLQIDATLIGQHAIVGGSGKSTIRHFCKSCGSSLFGSPGSHQGVATICGGTLDDPELFIPQVAVCAANRPSWSRLAIKCPEFAAMPAAKS